MGRYDSNDRHSRSRGGGGQQEAVTANALLDRFTDIDDLIRDTNRTLQQVAQTHQALAQASDDGTEFELNLPEESEASEFPFDFSTSVPEFPAARPEDPLVEVFETPKDGTLTDVLIGYPSGTQQAVGVRLEGVDGESLIPRGPSGAQFVAFDDEVIRFNLNEPIQKNEEITIKFANNDEENPHFVNVLLRVREDI